VRVEYKKSTRFADTVEITAAVVRFTGIKFTVAYTVKNQKGEVCCVGETDHAYVDATGRPLRLRDKSPEVYALMQNLVEGE
ncbi:MAG: hypothetical protein J6Z36_00050, partial [Clostridia bacterium]|nr:hypothetical protein [Clostridia bacterium]